MPELEQMTTRQLDENLFRFYAEARTKDKRDYSKSALLGFRHGIERYLNNPPLNRAIKIASNPLFTKSNQMLDANIKQLKQLGKENVQHKPPLEKEDLAKLKTSDVFNPINPLSLLRSVWFHVVLYWCRRGREGQRNLTVNSFAFEVDSSGRRYVRITNDESSKNHPGGLGDVSSTEKEARMYETDQPIDGYKALALYLEKVNPNCLALFQYPARSWQTTNTVWFENRPLGVKKIAKMMTEISQAAGLSKNYTNHSVRATAITVWSNAGIPNRHIMAISGHRKEQSLVHYNARTSSLQLRNCSDVLSRSLLIDDRLNPLSHTSSARSQPQHHISVTSTSTSSTTNTHLQNFAVAGSMFSSCSIGSVQIVYKSNSD